MTATAAKTWIRCGALASLAVIAAAAAAADELPPMDCVIEPHEVVDLSSAVDGVVHEVLVDRGDLVEEGQVVVRLDSGVEDAALAYARARASADAQLQAEQVNAEFARRRKDRLEALYKQKALASDQMDEVATDARLKQLQLEQAAEARRLAYLDMRQAEEVAKRHVIQSPLKGVVVRRYLSAGESVENKAIMRIAQIDPLRAEVIIPVAHFGEVQVGQKAVVVPEAPRDQPYPAVVTVVDRVADAASGTFRATLTLPNPDYALPSGLRCSVKFQAAAGLASTDTPEPPVPRPSRDSPALLASGDVPAPATTRGPAPGVSSLNAGPIQRQPELVAADPSRGPPRRLGPAAFRHTEQAARANGSAVSPQSDVATQPRATNATASSGQPTPGPRDASICKTFGPLASVAEAQALRANLSPIAHGVTIREQGTSAGGNRGYLVLSAVQPSLGEARHLLKRMGKAGLEDVAVLRSGPYARRVSAGAYTRRSAAMRRQASLAAIGFELDVVSRGEPSPSYWVDVRAADDPEALRRISATVRQIAGGAAASPAPCDPRVLTAHN